MVEAVLAVVMKQAAGNGFAVEFCQPWVWFCPFVVGLALGLFVEHSENGYKLPLTPRAKGTGLAV